VVNQSGAYAGVANSSVDNATGNITLGSRFISSLNGAASAPPGAFTGTWFTGGTATTTKPQVVIEPAGTTSTAWSTSGTGLGVNAASGFAGNLLDLQVNGTRKFNAQADGTFQITNSATRFVNVNSSAFLTVRYDDNTSVNLLTLANKGTNADGNGQAIVFETNGGVSASIAAVRMGGADNTALTFSTRAGIGNSSIEVLRLTPAGNAVFGDARNIEAGTTTGTKIGTATTQKLGFYNATPVVQPAAVADITTVATAGTLPTADGSVTVADANAPTNAELLEYCVELEAKLEAALAHLRTLGLIAT
jgi:hypothetical protein